MCQSTSHGHGFDGSVHELWPRTTLKCLNPRQEIRVFIISFQAHLKLGEFTVTRITQRLQDFMIKNIADFLICSTSKLIRTKIDHEYVGIKVPGNGVEQRLSGVVLQSLVQKLTEWFTTHLTLTIECKT